MGYAFVVKKNYAGSNRLGHVTPVNANYLKTFPTGTSITFDYGTASDNKMLISTISYASGSVATESISYALSGTATGVTINSINGTLTIGSARTASGNVIIQIKSKRGTVVGTKTITVPAYDAGTPASISIGNPSGNILEAINSTATATITASGNTGTLSASVSDSTNFTATISGTTLTVKATTANTSTSNRTVKVKVTGANGGSAEKTFTQQGTTAPKSLSGLSYGTPTYNYSSTSPYGALTSVATATPSFSGTGTSNESVTYAITSEENSQISINASSGVVTRTYSSSQTTTNQAALSVTVTATGATSGVTKTDTVSMPPYQVNPNVTSKVLIGTTANGNLYTGRTSNDISETSFPVRQTTGFHFNKIAVTPGMAITIDASVASDTTLSTSSSSFIYVAFVDSTYPGDTWTTTMNNKELTGYKTMIPTEFFWSNNQASVSFTVPNVTGITGMFLVTNSGATDYTSAWQNFLTAGGTFNYYKNV